MGFFPEIGLGPQGCHVSPVTANTNDWMSDWINEWKNEWMREWVNDGMMKKWMKVWWNNLIIEWIQN